MTTLDPVEGVLAVLDEGAATGTNKFALLLALIDLAPGLDPDAALPVNAIAEKLIEIHWEHVRAFRDVTLRQVTSGNRDNSTVVLATATLHRSMGVPDVLVPPFEQALPQLDATAWAQAVKRVAEGTLKNPLANLQNIRRQQVQFLYETPIQGREVRFLPGAVEALTRFGPVLRDLVEFRYVRQVVLANRVGLGPSVEDELAEHLFGASRHMPPVAMREALWTLQGGKCIYTDAVLPKPSDRQRKVSLDHVLPWSRVRLSAVENFLVTTPTTNSSKSNLLLAPRLLVRWVAYLNTRRDDLKQIADDFGWPTDLERVTALATGLYERAPSTTAVWHAQDSLRTLEDQGRRDALERLRRIAIAAPRTPQTHSTGVQGIHPTA